MDNRLRLPVFVKNFIEVKLYEGKNTIQLASPAVKGYHINDVVVFFVVNYPKNLYLHVELRFISRVFEDFTCKYGL